MRTIFDIGDKVECKVTGTISRIEISDHDERYEVQIQRGLNVPMYASVTFTRDQLMLMNSEKIGEKEHDNSSALYC